MQKIDINFCPVDDEYINFLEKPYPAITKNPEWVKQFNTYYTTEKKLDAYNMPTSTIKNCMPVRDMIGCGYHIPLPCDVWVEKIKDKNNKEITNFRWALNNIRLVEPHMKEQSDGMPVFEGHEKTPFKWNNYWIIQTPKNWSCLFIHPSYYDLPFTCLSAIVDTDKFPLSVNFPFFIKNGFTGLIKKGTPMIQVIPFKRENFNLTFSKYKKNLLYEWYKASSSFFNIYKNNFRSKKVFNISKCPFH